MSVIMNKFNFLVILNCILFNAFPVVASHVSDMGDAAQAPSFRSQADHGLFRLEECLPGRKVLQTNGDNNKMYLFGVRPDGDCAFHGLVLERRKVVLQLLAEIQSNEAFSMRLIMPDIKAAFMGDQLPRTMKTPHNMGLVEKFCRCNRRGHDVEKANLAVEVFDGYLSDQFLQTQFIQETLGKGEFLSFIGGANTIAGQPGILDGVAYINKLNVLVWRLKAGVQNTVELAHQTPWRINEDWRTVHLLHRGQHFERLVPEHAAVQEFCRAFKEEQESFLYEAKMKQEAKAAQAQLEAHFDEIRRKKAQLAQLQSLIDQALCGGNQFSANNDLAAKLDRAFEHVAGLKADIVRLETLFE